MAVASDTSIEHAVIVDDRNIPWHDTVMARFEHVCQLRQGWDGYDARPIDFGTANFALRVLHAICTPSTPAPFIVPGVDGDLQIEWHTEAWDIEIHVLAPNVVEAWRAPADRRDAEEESFKTTIDFTSLCSWVKTLSEPALADFASAAR